MKYILSFFLFSTTLCHFIYSQSLVAGDIAFVQYNADGTDNFAFLCLTDIPSGTTIFFTDNEPNNLGGGEGTITWSTNATVSCGTIVTIDYSPSESSGLATVTETNSLNFSGDGDGLWAYTGSSISPTYIAAIGLDGSADAITTSKEGDITGTGLTIGLNAVAPSELDNCIYTGDITTGTRAEILTAINTSFEWSGSNTVNQTFSGFFVIDECQSGSLSEPDAPTITSIDNGDGQVAINFTPGFDGGSVITDYKYSVDGGAFISMSTTSSPYILSGLINGVDYDIQILAVNSVGDGTPSASVTGSPFENYITLSSLDTEQSEDFNTLASSGSSSFTPPGWFFNESGSNANDTYSSNTGTSSSGNTYSYGTGSERSLGGLLSNTLNPSWGAKIKNELGEDLRTLVITYTGETWRVGSASRSDQVIFEYSIDATSLSDGTWIPFNKLDYANPGQNTGNGSLQHSQIITDTLSGLALSNGSFIWFRWTDQNVSGSDDGMSIDDFSVKAICRAPTNSSVEISSNSSPAKENENLNAAIIAADPDGVSFVSANDWRVDGTSLAVQNFSFDANGTDGLTSNSSQGGTLTAYGDATQSGGVKGQAYEFDGNGDYLQNSSLNIDPSNGLSMSFWTFSNNLGTGFQRWINLGATGSGEQFVLRKASSNVVEAYIKTGDNHSNWCSGCSTGDFIYLSGQVLANQWQHWVLTWDGETSNGQMKLYRNGVLLHTTTTAAGGLLPITSLSISQSNSTGWIGKIDEILIFERDISADQVTALYNSGTPNYDVISSDEIQCGETWSLITKPVNNYGCQGQETQSTDVPIVGAQVSTADVIDYTTTCGIQEYSIEIDDLTSSGSWEVSPANAVLFSDPTSQSTTITIDPTENRFNEDLTLTWTPTNGNCPSDDCIIHFSAPSPSGSMDTDSWVWGGLTNTIWSESTNWYKWNGVQWIKSGGSSGLTIPDAGDKIYVLPTNDICVGNNLTNAATSIGDLNIQGGTLDFGSSNTTITGNIVNEGTIQGGTGTITIGGSSDQTISGSGAVNFNNLTVNKSSGNLILSSATNVGSRLTMTKGNIVNSQPLVLGSSSASPGTLSHLSGIVTGEMRRYFANTTGSRFFPVGTSSNMRDVTINFTQAPGTDEYLTVSYVAGAPTLSGADGAYSGLPLITNDNQLIQNYSADGYWNIDPTGGLYESTEINSAAYEITLHCKALSVQPTDVSKVRIIKSAGSENGSMNHVSWTGLDLLSSSGTGADFTVTAAATGFSKFGAGSEDGNPLPVELVSFSGACNDGVVELIWETASEYNSSHFDVENSRDGITWDVVKTIEAAGNSNELLTYGYNDVNAHGGDNYYRLIQVDFDGTAKTYDVINVSCAQTTSGYFSIFPNPSSGSFQVMLNNSDIVGQAEMNIVDTKGNKVFMKSIDVKSGINMFVINEGLAPGIYYIEILDTLGTKKREKHIVL